MNNTSNKLANEYIKRNKAFLLLLLLWMFRLFFLRQGNEGGVAINKFVIVQLFAELSLFYLLISRKFKFSIIFTNQPMIFFCLLYLFGMLSIFWGVLPLMGCYFAFQNIIMVAVLYYLATQTRDIFQLERYYIFANLLILGVFLFRGFCFGDGLHSVAYSTVAALLFVYCIAEYDNSRPPENLKMLKRGIIVGGTVLILSTSSGAIVSVVVSIFVLAMFAKNIFLRGVSFIAMITILFSYFLGIFEWLIPIIFPDKSMASITTAHGRTVIWDMIFEKAAMRPLLGWGYASVERILDIYCVDAHNSVIGVIGSLGYIGGGFLIIAMISIFFYMLFRQKYIGFRGLLAATVCGLVNSNTSNFLASKAGLQALSFQMIMVLGAVYFLMQTNTKKSVIDSENNNGK